MVRFAKTFLLRKALLLGLLALLCLPGLCMWYQPWKLRPLSGDVQAMPNVSWTMRGWLDGTYQQQKERYFNDSVGFRSTIVRLNNELDFVFFGKLHARNVVMGTNGYLYEQPYIDTYHGRDFDGYDTLRETARKLRYIQDTLRRAGKIFVFTFVPSKARYFPEHMPRKEQGPPAASSNYLVLHHLCDSFGIEQIDFNGWFRSQKGRTAHAQYSKGGTHWTRWAALRAADSFNHYLEGRMSIDIPDLQIGAERCGEVPLDGENDIEAGLNLLRPYAKETWCYNDLEVPYDSTHQHRPAVIFIADSYFWTWSYLYIPHNCYKNWEFWYYFGQIYDRDVVDGKHPALNMAETDWMAHLAKGEAFIIFLTEPNLHGIKERFVDQLYRKLGGF